GPPVAFIVEEVLDAGEQPTFEPVRLALAGPLGRQAADVPQVAVGGLAAVAAGVPGLGRQPGEGDEDLALHPVLGGAEDTLTELPLAEQVAAGQDAHLVDRAVEGQGDHRVPGLVVRGGLVERRLRLHDRILPRRHFVSSTLTTPRRHRSSTSRLYSRSR